jgi:hypothetical protein
VDVNSDDYVIHRRWHERPRLPARRPVASLAVFDTEFSRGAALQVLVTAGFRVTAATDFSGTLRDLAVARPDLVVIDVALRGLDGLHGLWAPHTHLGATPVTLRAVRQPRRRLPGRHYTSLTVTRPARRSVANA